MTQETTIDVPKAYWWTQNKRGDWRAKYRRTSVVKRRAYLTYRSLINSGKPAANQMASARHRHHPPLDTRQIRS